MLNYYSWWVGQKKTKLMLYSTLVEIEVEVGVELGNTGYFIIILTCRKLEKKAPMSSPP